MIPELHALKPRSVPETPARSGSNRTWEDRRTMERGESFHPVSTAAPRILAATLASPVLAFWGFLVGTFVGWQCADSLLGLMPSTFFLMFLRMIWYRDIVGIMIKGMIFGFLIGLIACYGGIRTEVDPADDVEAETPPEAGANQIVHSVLRSTCIAMVAILIANSSWFILAYHSVPSWGPTLLKPPSP